MIAGRLAKNQCHDLAAKLAELDRRSAAALHGQLGRGPVHAGGRRRQCNHESGQNQSKSTHKSILLMLTGLRIAAGPHSIVVPGGAMLVTMHRGPFLLALIVPLLTRQTFSPTNYAGLRWREIGPFRGGRTVGAAGIAGQPNVFYIAVNNGGVWKTDDYGRTWKPIFDDQPTGSIGAVAVPPSDPNTIYVGSGEGLQRPDLSTGGPGKVDRHAAGRNRIDREAVGFQPLGDGSTVGLGRSPGRAEFTRGHPRS